MALSRFLAPGAAVVAAALMLGSASVVAQQAPPVARVYGSIQVNGANASSGAVVTAFSGSTLCGTSTGAGNYNGSQYFVDIDSSQTACSAAGTTLTFQVNGQKANETAQVPAVSSAVQLNLTVTSGPAAPTVTYQAGWNIVAGPSGTTFPQSASPLYFLNATTGGTYAQQPATQGVVAGQGYWALFNAPTTVTLSGTSQASATVTLPAGQYVQIGNPSATKTVTVSGADVVYVYSTSAGYTATTTLAPGQGAWAFSANGATATIQ